MAKARGFKLGRRLVRVFGCLINRRIRPRGSYQRLGQSNCATRAISKLCSWGRTLRTKLNSGYIRVGQEPFEESKPVMSVPKGHLAVYVGEKNDDACRVVVPVIYFNHPLFAGLLNEAENAYGFDHPGGIQIPCRKSEFENVKMRIAASAGGGGRCRGRRSWRRSLLASRSDHLDH